MVFDACHDFIDFSIKEILVDFVVFFFFLVKDKNKNHNLICGIK